MTKRLRAYVGLGANVGDARENLRRALRALAALPGVRVRAVSSLYRTRPVGVTDQPDFLNAAAALDVPAARDPETGALALLAGLKELEQAIGREPRERWGPREIDLDLLLFGSHRINAGRPDGHWLEVPHPHMSERLFVLAPLAELSPGLRPPGWNRTVSAARAARSEIEGAGAVRRIAEWQPHSHDWR
ncbi:MAG: 2-amino-4-hydroxy-6-hydroxymethyldihydropteridine diphosphokinase [Chloroflexota bacterium]|nr:2-amino-4-hydroxy-6-hydroxymethyldihydropteridine diphosphokinase [Chloroflexota bacterium]